MRRQCAVMRVCGHQISLSRPVLPAPRLCKNDITAHPRATTSTNSSLQKKTKKKKQTNGTQHKKL
jgi:hypothetical protein